MDEADLDRHDRETEENGFSAKCSEIDRQRERDARDAARYRHLRANHLIEDDNGLLQIRFETCRMATDHPLPRRLYWLDADIDSEMGVETPDDDACSACGGLGRRYNVRPGSYIVDEPVECEACGGTGEIKQSAGDHNG